MLDARPDIGSHDRKRLAKKEAGLIQKSRLSSFTAQLRHCIELDLSAYLRSDFVVVANGTGVVASIVRVPFCTKLPP